MYRLILRRVWLCELPKGPQTSGIQKTICRDMYANFVQLCFPFSGVVPVVAIGAKTSFYDPHQSAMATRFTRDTTHKQATMAYYVLYEYEAIRTKQSLLDFNVSAPQTEFTISAGSPDVTHQRKRWPHAHTSPDNCLIRRRPAFYIKVILLVCEMTLGRDD